MKQGSRALVAALVSLAMAGSGCSMAFQSHIPDRPGSPSASPDQVASCSTSRTLPWVDVGIIGAELAVASASLLNGEQAVDLGMSHDAATVVVGAALLGAILQTASAGNGFRRAAACERARTGQAPTATAAL